MAVETLCSSNREERKQEKRRKKRKREKGTVSRAPDENCENFS